MSLTLNSKFVATISGTVALEAAVLGKKALIFGSTWFSGCPNTINWYKEINYKNIFDSPIKNSDEIISFLLKRKEKISIPGYQNASHFKSNISLIDKEFKKSQEKSILNLLEQLFEKV